MSNIELSAVKRRKGEVMNSYMMDKEIQEAIISGERALNSLRNAQEKLNSARNWGIIWYSQRLQKQENR